MSSPPNTRASEARDNELKADRSFRYAAASY